MKHLTLILALTACGSVEQSDLAPASDELVEMFHVKKSELEAKVVDGWISRKDCDSTLWNGLALYSDQDIDLGLVEYPEDGYIQRRPRKSCYPGDSRSTVSNDMFMGLMWGAYGSGNTDLLERIWHYGEHHDWVMGQPWPGGVGEVLMKPHMILLLGKLTGRDPKIPPVLTPVKEDYARHIQTLWILLYGQVSHQITSQMSDYLLDHHKADRNDCLFLLANELYNKSDLSTDLSYAGCLMGLANGDREAPTYVRGRDKDAYLLIHWLFTASLACQECLQ